MSADTALLAHSDCESDEEAFPIRRMGEHIPMIDPHHAARPSDAVENDEESLYPATDSAAQLKASPYYAQYTQEFRRPEGSATCCPCGHMEGNNAHLCGSGKLFPFVCIIGPDWPCNACTWALMIVPAILFTVFIAPTLHVGVVVAEIVLLVASCICLALTAWSDPGFIPRNTPAEAEQQRLRLVQQGKFDHSLCSKCNTWRRGTSVHHCYANGRCVEQYDHHCPWMGKAIGGLTLKFFYGFLYSVCSMLALTAISTVIWLLQGGPAEV